MALRFYLFRRYAHVVLVILFVLSYLAFDAFGKSSDISFVSDCPHWQGIEDVFVIMRTGATESQQRLPPQFNTTFKCLPNFAVFSDFEETIDGHQVYDSLDEYDTSVVAKNKEFILHERLQQFGRSGLKSNEVNGGKASPGWMLDKWKFLPLINKALRMNYNAKWYIIMDADTHIVFSTMLHWLRQLDHTKPHYIGARWFIDGQAFAQGGSGMVISGPAMRMAGRQHADNIETYHNYTRRKWAGDEVLGRLMQDAGVPCTDTQPIMQSFPPSLMYGGDTLDRHKEKRLWCYPAATYHHMTSNEISDVFEFERRWTSQKNFQPIRHGHVFEHVVVPQILPEREQWDNRPEDSKFERKGRLTSYTRHTPSISSRSKHEWYAEESFENCKQLCRSREDCMQFLHEPGHCVVSSVFVQGRPRGGKDSPKSGWMTDRIARFVEQQNRKRCPPHKDLWVIPS